VTGGALGSGTRPTEWLPEDSSFVSWSQDPQYATASTVFVGGDLMCIGLLVRRQVPVTTLTWSASAAGVGVTAGQNFAGLYNSAGVLLASVGVDAQAAASGAQAAVFASQSIAAGLYYGAVLFNAATSIPTLIRANGAQATANNLGTPAARPRATRALQAQTSLPPTLTLSAGSVDKGFFLALS
jgi:hypothetical protein